MEEGYRVLGRKCQLSIDSPVGDERDEIQREGGVSEGERTKSQVPRAGRESNPRYLWFRVCRPRH